jgi:hypothetical protein
MTAKSKIAILPFLIACLFAADLCAQLYSLQTHDLRLVYYDKANEYLVPHAARCFENAWRFNRRLFKYTSPENVTVFLQDLRDYGNAAALTVPRNLISLSIAPNNYIYETSPANERINSTLNHEVVHVITMDEASGSDKFFRALLGGKVAPIAEQPISIVYRFLTAPRWNSPRWYIEGIAVFKETWMSGGLGRAQGAYDEMVFRTKVHDDSGLYDVVGLEAEGTAIDFQGGATSYLYGTRFMTYLAYRHGPGQLLAWTSRRQGSKAYFASQFKHTYGVPLNDEWSRWIEWEKAWQRANLDSIRVNPLTSFRPLSQRALGSASRFFYDSSAKKLYAAIRYPGQVASLAAIDLDDGAIENLGDVKGSAGYYVTSLAYDPAGSRLFYTTDNNDWRDLNALEIKTGKSRRLMRDARVGDLAFNQADQSLWGVRHYNGISTIVRLPPPYTEWNQIYSWPYGKDVFDLDISRDGARLTAGLAEISGRQKLILLDVQNLLKGDASYEVLFDFETSTPVNFIFSAEGNYLYGSSYYSGVSNIFRYDFAAKDMQVMSNAETGFFRPLPVSEDSLIVLHYTAKGFIPAKMAIQPQASVNAIRYLGQAVAEKHPVVKTWKLDAPSPAKINLDSLTTFTGAYHPMRNLRLASAYPIVEGYKDYAAYGLRFNFSDPILLHHLDLTASFTPNQNLPADERLHAALNYRFWNWKVSATYNNASFYDLFGPTKTSRKGYSASVQYKKYLIFDDPRTLDYTLGVAGYGGLERLPDFQNVAASFDKFLTLKAGLTYQFFQRSIGAVDEEKGVKWQLGAAANHVRSKFFPRAHANFDCGLALPLNHSSIWQRNSAGYSSGGRREPFANFYFGGFGNNWVDYLEARRYREDYSFPGVEINGVAGTNYAKSLVEWTLPPLRFRRLGFQALYCNWARLALFSAGIITNLESAAARRRLVNAGGQVDFRLAFLSSLESTFSLGYALAAEKGRRPEKEFMISLKLLR